MEKKTPFDRNYSACMQKSGMHHERAELKEEGEMFMPKKTRKWLKQANTKNLAQALKRLAQLNQVYDSTNERGCMPVIILL